MEGTGGGEREEGFGERREEVQVGGVGKGEGVGEEKGRGGERRERRRKDPTGRSTPPAVNS